MKYKLLISLIIIFSFLGCKVNKIKEIEVKGGLDEAVKKVINDYSSSNRKYMRKYDVFEISKTKIDNHYRLSIAPRRNYYYIGVNDTLGAYTKTFPNNFEIYKKKLFVWNDNNTTLNKAIINQLQRFNKLDSIKLKYQLGIYDVDDMSGKYPDIPTFKIDETIKESVYIILGGNGTKW